MKKGKNIFILYSIIFNSLIEMLPKLHFTTKTFIPSSTRSTLLDLSGRCAFALCIEGELTIKILNRQYVVTSNCMFACMPFLNVELLEVKKPSRILFGQILIADLPLMINRWVNTDNICTIQTQPLVSITDEQFKQLMTSVEFYVEELRESNARPDSRVCSQIQKDIIDLQGRIIIAKVLKIYFTNLTIEVAGYTHRDLIFQRFMLSLYANFRKHRDVGFYASNSGVSLKYFSTLIKQLSGRSPSQWIEAVVTGEAKTLLSEKGRPVKEIAAMLNFPDAPTFTKYFLRVTNLTPKAYRLTLPQ